MTKREKLLTFTALTILLTSGFPALAQESDDTPPPPMGDERPMMRDGEGPHGPKGDRPDFKGKQAEMEKRGAEMFAKADTNKDGFLSKEEMLNAHKERIDEMFEKVDTNKDGKLSPEEMKKGREIMREKFKEKMKDKHGDWKDRDGAKGKNRPSGDSTGKTEE